MLLTVFSSARSLMVVMACAAIVLVSATACTSGNGESQVDNQDGLSLVWEAWDAVNANYAAPDSLDQDAVAGATIERIMDLGDLDPYPFLTDLGRMRGQVPPEVPDSLIDVWRASEVYRHTSPDIEPEEFQRILIQGMMEGLPGPVSAYLSPEQLPEARERMDNALRGSYVGIGANVVAQEGRILLFPFSDSPAEKAGIEQGDTLLAVDGVGVAESSPSEVGERVKGPEGTKVRLQLERAGEAEALELEVFRGHIELDSVASQLIQGGIGYIRVARFRENTGAQVFEALERLKRFDMLALILDLRRNPGGEADAAADVAAQFLPAGSTFRYVEGRDGARTDHAIPDDADLISLEGLPVAVMVDGGTAGEAEALAAALQQGAEIPVVGVPTYGEGSDYEFVELSDGSALFLPTSLWFTRDGTWVGEEPVQPDVYVEYEEVPVGVGGERQLNATYELLDSQLPLFR